MRARWCAGSCPSSPRAIRVHWTSNILVSIVALFVAWSRDLFFSQTSGATGCLAERLEARASEDHRVVPASSLAPAPFPVQGRPPARPAATARPCAAGVPLDHAALAPPLACVASPRGPPVRG